MKSLNSSMASHGVSQGDGKHFSSSQGRHNYDGLPPQTCVWVELTHIF